MGIITKKIKSCMLYCNNSDFKKEEKQHEFFCAFPLSKKGNVGVAFIISRPHPFSFELRHTRQFRNIAHPSKEKQNLVYKKTMSILLKTSTRKILVVENKNKNGVIESPKQKKKKKKKKRGVLNPPKKKKKKKKKK